MDRLLSDAEKLADIFEDMSAIFTDDQLRLFRTNKPPTPEMATTTMQIVSDLAVLMMRAHPHGVKKPRFRDLPNTFIFRMALCSTVSFLKWIRAGGQRDTKPEKIRNDMVDVMLATYATYFDGLLTHDRKLRSLFAETSVLLGYVKDNVAVAISGKR